MAKTKQKFYNGDKIRAQDAHINIIFGEKSNGKSYDVKHYVLKDFRDTGKQFFLCRRNKMDVTTSKMALYLADVDVKSIFPDYDICYANAGSIFIAQLDEETGFKKNAICVGFYGSLTDAQHMSGLQYPNVRHFILEEFVAIGEEAYLPDEMTWFDILLSNVLRRRDDFKIWLLGNALSRMCPYFDYYGITRIVARMNVGDMEIVERETDNGMQKIAIEYCENAGGTSNLFSKKRSGMINSGKWHVEAQPRLPGFKSEWRTRYTVVFEYDDHKWLAEILSKGSEYVVFISPKTTEIQKKTRVISNRFSASRYYTADLTPLCQSDKVLFDLMAIGKICFSDDLTGTEFKQVSVNFK